VKAVHLFGEMPEANDLAAANKRISKLLKKQTAPVTEAVDETALVEAAELELYSAIVKLEADCPRLFDDGDYALGLQKLASLRTPIDVFFENVMVMSDDATQQQNRLALLSRIQGLSLCVADISLLQS